MARQMNLLPPGQIIPVALHTEMQQSYLEYAMSVIVGRALPDVRDGLKPVHRRILYAMYELGLVPDQPYRKCARVVGDVLGKYHPHGDQAVYDALVRLVQEFSSRYPLLAGHGNFGSVDDDPPAAMRYTETRLAQIGHECLLGELTESIVDFVSNFDNSQQEPSVLPAQLPFLLLNGSAGIAVGMATNVPPHNLGEVIDGLVALIDRPQITDEQLMELIPAPDFPTGGEIIDLTGCREAYRTGRGSIPVRGIVHLEEVQSGRGRRRNALVVTELPYQVCKAAWIEKVADLVNQNRLEGIADLRDESDRQGMRVVIELKREADAEKLLAELYRQTALQSNFGAIFLALVDGQPRQLSLKELLQNFLQFRETTLLRRYRHELQQASQRAHIVEGLLLALQQVDLVIDILRRAIDGSTARLGLQERLGLSERQADAILAMPLRRLTGTEQQNLQAEYGELTAQIEGLQRLINDRHELLKALKKDLRAIKRKHADSRRTKIAAPLLLSSSLPTDSDKGAEPVLASPLEVTSTRPRSRSRGRVNRSEAASLETSPTPVADLNPEHSRQPLPGLIPFQAEQTQLDLQAVVTDTSPVVLPSRETLERSRKPKAEPPAIDPDRPVVLQISMRGHLRLLLEDNQPRLTATDYWVQSQVSPTIGQLLLFTLDGRLFSRSLSDIPVTDEQGIPLSNLLPQAGGAIVQALLRSDLVPFTDLLLLSQQGRAKRLALADLGDIPNRGISLWKTADNDRLLSVCPTRSGEQIVLATSIGRLLRFEVSADQIPRLNRTAQGVLAVRLAQQEQIVGCLSLPPNAQLLLVSTQGYGKILPVQSLRALRQGEIGQLSFQFIHRHEQLAGAIALPPLAEVYGMTSDDQLVSFSLPDPSLLVKEIPLFSLSTHRQLVRVQG